MQGEKGTWIFTQLQHIHHQAGIENAASGRGLHFFINIAELARDESLPIRIMAASRKSKKPGLALPCRIILHGFVLLPGAERIMSADLEALGNLFFFRSSATRDMRRAHEDLCRKIEEILCRSGVIFPDPAFLFRVHLIEVFEKKLFPLIEDLLAGADIHSIELSFEAGQAPRSLMPYVRSPGARKSIFFDNPVVARSVLRSRILRWFPESVPSYYLSAIVGLVLLLAVFGGWQTVQQGRILGEYLLHNAGFPSDRLNADKTEEINERPSSEELAALAVLVRAETWVSEGYINALSPLAGNLGERLRNLAGLRLGSVIAKLTAYDAGVGLADPLAQATLLGREARVFSRLTGSDEAVIMITVRGMMRRVGGPNLSLQFLERDWVRKEIIAQLAAENPRLKSAVRASLDQRNRILQRWLEGLTVQEMVPVIDKFPYDLKLARLEGSDDEKLQDLTAFFNLLIMARDQLATPRAKFLSIGCSYIDHMPLWDGYDPFERTKVKVSICKKIMMEQEILLKQMLPSGEAVFVRDDSGHIALEPNLRASLDMLEALTSEIPSSDGARDLNTLVMGNGVPEPGRLFDISRRLETIKIHLDEVGKKSSQAGMSSLQNYLSLRIGIWARNALVDGTTRTYSLEQNIGRFNAALPGLRRCNEALAHINPVMAEDMKWFFGARAYRLLAQVQERLENDPGFLKRSDQKIQIIKDAEPLLSYVLEGNKDADLSRLSVFTGRKYKNL